MPKFLGRVLFGLILFSYLSLSADICIAQYSGSIQGVLTDSSGAAIADARINLRNLDTGIEHTTKTSNSGNYSFPSLAPGHYVVRAEAKGFRPKK